MNVSRAAKTRESCQERRQQQASKSTQTHVTQEEVCLHCDCIKSTSESRGHLDSGGNEVGRARVYSPGPLPSSGRPYPFAPCLFWPSSLRHPRWPPACTPLSLSGSRTNRRKSQLLREHMWQRGSSPPHPPLRSTPPNRRFHFKHSQHCSPDEDPAGA